MSYFPSQTVSTCNKSRHLRERGKEAVRCCLLASQQATEVIPARQPFYTLLGAKLSLCETWAQSWMTARGQWDNGAGMWLLPFGSFQQRGGATWGAVMDDCTGTMGRSHG